MLRAIMAVSLDGFVCKGPEDDMRWTGGADKQLFRQATVGCHLGAGRKTHKIMPSLQGSLGRHITCIAREPKSCVEMTLGDFYRTVPDGWLIGGQTVVISAIREGFVNRILLSHVRAALGSGQPDEVTKLVSSMGWQGRVFPQEELTLVTWVKP